MKPRPFVVACVIFFVLAAVAHLMRLVRHVSVEIGQVAIPEWSSWIAVIVAGTLAVWGARIAREN